MLCRFSKIQMKHKRHRKSPRVFSQGIVKIGLEKSETPQIDAKNKIFVQFFDGVCKSKAQRWTVRLLAFLYFRTLFIYRYICLRSTKRAFCVLFLNHALNLELNHKNWYTWKTFCVDFRKSVKKFF